MEKGSDPFAPSDDPASDEEDEDLPEVTKAFVKTNKGKEGGRQPTNTQKAYRALTKLDRENEAQQRLDNRLLAPARPAAGKRSLILFLPWFSC